MKALPYWGTAEERKLIRKYWQPNKLYSKVTSRIVNFSVPFVQSAQFHVLVTSYNMMVQDEKHFHRIKWQYVLPSDPCFILFSIQIYGPRRSTGH